MNTIIFVFLLLVSCSGSGDDSAAVTTEPQRIVPVDLILSVTLVGANTTNSPYGDGTGVIQCTAIATNAVKYGFKFDNDSEIESISGNINHTFSEVGTNSHNITVFAYSNTGHSISTFQNVMVFVEENDGPNLVWSDEFEVDGGFSSSNWFAETVPPNNGSWWNNEKQHYTSRIENVYVSEGTLKIVAKKEEYTYENSTKNYTSARLTTKDRFAFTFGRVDVRAKLPSSKGTWPAIWLLGDNIDQVGWPRCGEIDIMEQTGWDKAKVLGTCHWFDNASSSNASYGLDTVINTATSEFHVYSMEWTSTHIKIFVDDVEFYEIALNSNLPFYADQFLILNIALGGNLGGDIDPDFTEDTMEIDYVRVYQ